MPFPINYRSLSVGNRAIDSEHQKLGSIINDIGQLILVNHADALSEAFKILDDNLRAYFVSEEKIAQAVNFDFARHRLAHQDLLNKFRFIKDNLMSQICKWSIPERKICIDSLNDCLIQHIKEDSRPFKIVLDTYLYDFKTG